MSVGAVLDATGAKYWQLCQWRERGWLHTPSLDTVRPYPWLVEIRQIDWLARLYLHRDRPLDDEDAAAGYRLRVHGAKWGIRVGWDRWRPAGPGDLCRDDPFFTVAVVVRPEIAALVERNVA